MSEQIDLRVCYAYSRSQSEERRACKAVLGEILSGLMSGRKSEFSAFSGKIHSSDISDADFIAGDPSHNKPEKNCRVLCPRYSFCRRTTGAET